MTTATPAPAQPTEADLRGRVAALADPDALTVTLLLINGHRTDSPTVYDVPISTDLADALLNQVAETASAAADAELRPMQPGHTPAAHEWVHGTVDDGPLVDVEPMVLAATHLQYDRSTDFGRRSLLALRVRRRDGQDLGRLYQGFSPEKALAQHTKIMAVWTGERFASLDAQPLVIDRSLRLFVFGGETSTVVLMKSNSAYESLFGALPDLRARAASTYAATLGRLDIVGAEALQAACESDINMMRKLLSIQHKMDQPGYPEALDMPSVLSFLERNEHIDVPIDRSGNAPALVFSPQPQHRWALLKLLDDDFLRSDLTNINYEANSKIEVVRNRGDLS
ncbi:protein of unknown function [Nakamurella panacisegetis]|uniref:DUF4868 domain-containing protein n=1 Tax=Nakamurella panacisegetis TaxID=1090615 RepID=A0A1H0I1A0_9ACTN|nr:Kiwa anti-phage protein KwaB-like domain-containing protein [Nakamurella panacisegetis]SDO24861.1 protein of unknown function [Nakamurella panacisegetis]